MRAGWVLAVGLGAMPARALGEPLFAISDDTLVVRAAGAASWGGDDRELGAAFHGGALINKGILAADLGLGANTAGPTVFTALPSVGLKLKFLSTPENMGYTYVHLGVRAMSVQDDSIWAPCLGIRDFITFDLVGRWAFALEWHALASVPTRTGFDDLTLDGGIAVGIAHGEETARNLAVVAGWKRERLVVGTLAYVADGAFLSVSHQWR